MTHTIAQLSVIAEHLMRNSRDPVHDLAHVQRVATRSRTIGETLELTRGQLDALSLGALWHDAARTISSRPSVLIMPFFDDALSAVMLCWTAIKLRTLSRSVRLAIKIVLCKNMGTTKVLTRLLLSKENRVLVDILQDADTLDILHQERIIGMMDLAGRNYFYHLGYKFVIRFYLMSSQLKMKTNQARELVLKELHAFIEWMRSADVYAWHITRYGKVWVDAMLEKGIQLIKHIEQLHIVRMAT